MEHFFSGCATVTEIKSLYRRLAMQHHPDHGGDCKTMQEINAQYLSALAGKNESHERGSDGEQHVYYYNAKDEQAIIDKIAELLHLRLPGIEVWLIGKWIWVKGDTRPVKDALKAAGLRWHGERLAWYWKPYSGYTHYNKDIDFDGLARTYGARMFDTEKAAGMATA